MSHPWFTNVANKANGGASLDCARRTGGDLEHGAGFVEDVAHVTDSFNSVVREGHLVAQGVDQNTEVGVASYPVGDAKGLLREASASSTKP